MHVLPCPSPALPPFWEVIEIGTVSLDLEREATFGGWWSPPISLGWLFFLTLLWYERDINFCFAYTSVWRLLGLWPKGQWDTRKGLIGVSGKDRSHHVGQKKHPGESRPGGIVREQYILEAAVQSLSLSLIPHSPHPSSPISFLLSTTTITSLPFKRQTGKIPPLVSFKISFPVLKTSCLLSQVLSRQELTEAFFQIKSVLSWRKIVASEIFSTNEPCISYAHHFSDIQGWNNFSSFSFSILSRLFPPLLLPLFLTPGSPFLHPFVQLEEIKLSMMRCPVIFFRSIAVLIPKNKLPHCRTVHTESMNKH